MAESSWSLYPTLCFAEEFAVQGYIGFLSENTVVSFPVYEHRGKTTGRRWCLHPSQCELICASTTFLKGFYCPRCSFLAYCIFSPGHVCLRHIALRAQVSAGSSSILSLGRSACNVSRGGAKGIHEVCCSTFGCCLNCTLAIKPHFEAIRLKEGGARACRHRGERLR